MRRGIKIGIAVAGLVVVLPVVGIIAIIGLFVGVSQFNRDVSLLGKYSLQIMAVDHRRKTAESQRTWFSQRAGYRPPGSAEIEWFGADALRMQRDRNMLEYDRWQMIAGEPRRFAGGKSEHHTAACRVECAGSVRESRR
jgi:hypothetical protein